MKGVVFNLLEEVVKREKGEAAWDALLSDARLEGVYTSLGSYPAVHFHDLLEAASSALDMPVDDIVVWFGRRAIPMLVERYPKLFASHSRTRSFLLDLNDVIHPEVRKLYPGADAPVFDYDTSSDEFLVMTYRSHRELCSLGEGLTGGVAEYFGERADSIHLACMKRGDDRCVFRIAFERVEPPP